MIKQKVAAENEKQSSTALNSPIKESDKKNLALEVDISQSRVEKFMFDSHSLVKQMSDHYGVSTVIRLV